MYQVTAKGPRAAVEAAWDALAGADPSPAAAVDAKEDSRKAWRLDCYCETEDDAALCVDVIEMVSPELSARAEPIIEQDWVAMSLDGLPPVHAGPFMVAGDHALAQASPGRIKVLIEAGHAFGTGHHGTTLGCLLALDKLARRRRIGRVLDLGTGSGVLSIAALKAGAPSAIGTDIDRDSVFVATANAKANNVAARFKAMHINGARHPSVRKAAPFDTVFANILARPLVRLSPDIQRLTAPGGTIILSGLLEHQEPQVKAAFAGRGLSLKDRIHRDGWSTLVFQKPA